MLLNRSGCGVDAFPGSLFPHSDLRIIDQLPEERVHMHHAIQLTNTTSTTSFGTVSLQRVLRPCRRIVALAFALAWFALSPPVRAVVPPPDGGYLNANTAEGEDALFSLTTGTDNTALGFHALHDNSSGQLNTATGSNALASNKNSDTNTA